MIRMSDPPARLLHLTTFSLPYNIVDETEELNAEKATVRTLIT